MEGWSGNIWSRVVSWDDWTPSWIQSSKEATCRVFGVDFHQLRSRSCPRLYTLHYTNPVWWLGLTGFKKPSNLQLHQNKCSRRWQPKLRSNFARPFWTWGLVLCQTYHTLIEAWRIHHRFGSCSRWIHRSQGVRRWPGNMWFFPQPGTCHWKPNYHDQPRYITVVKYCDSEPLILISLRWNFIVWGIKCHIHGTPETGESHRSTGGAVTNCPAPCFGGFSTSSWLRRP